MTRWQEHEAFIANEVNIKISWLKYYAGQLRSQLGADPNSCGGWSPKDIEAIKRDLDTILERAKPKLKVVK